MEKFTNKQVIEKLIVETDGKVKQAMIMDRYAQRKAVTLKSGKKTWEDMATEQQSTIKEGNEFIGFLEEIKAEYE